MPNLLQIAANAQQASERAGVLRADLRHSTIPGEETRERRIRRALAQLASAMEPVRAEIGRLAWEPQPEATEQALRRASRYCQYERRQLKKMLR